jgi:dsRNA-specific ribonuclease
MKLPKWRIVERRGTDETWPFTVQCRYPREEWVTLGAERSYSKAERMVHELARVSLELQPEALH